RASVSSATSGGLSAFSTLGRFRVTTPTGPSRSTRTFSYSIVGIIGHVNGGMARRRTQATLRDSYGRVADDLRISVTDRCNFRCVYCMPAEGLRWLGRAEVLRYEEIHR